MEISSLVEKAGGSLNARRVFSDPIEKDGTVVVLAASVRGGAGGGEGHSERTESQPKGEGGGAGFGLVAKPAGAFVIRDGRVAWRPAIDVNKVILGGQLVMATGLLVARAVLTGPMAKRRTRRRFRRGFRRVH